MIVLVYALGVLMGGGVLALAAGRGRAARLLGGLSAALGALLGLVPAVMVLCRPQTVLSGSFSVLPLGESFVRLDGLSALFLVPLLVLSCCCALYGALAPPAGRQHAGAFWFFYNMLVSGMVLVTAAADAFTFLMSWELMSLAPFFIIRAHSPDAPTQRAAWTYLVAAHLGALSLLAFFGLVVAGAGALSFETIRSASTGAGLLPCVLALAGFGTKAGIMPLHIWLPEAHPAAPGHVSALMSGAMITTGIYGLIRALCLVGWSVSWWPWVLMGAGAFSGAAGIVFAMAQNNMKRALAYSSVENMGIVLLGLGLALFCAQRGGHALACLLLAGALLHMLNHSLLKGMLFLAAGGVAHAAGTLSVSRLGGLQRRMPVTGFCFALGAAAIAGLPPFNGFAGEFLLYCGMAMGGAALPPETGLALWLCLFVLAGMGGFALLCFARLYGLAFLGQARTPEAAAASEPARARQAVTCCLALLCLGSAIAAPWLVRDILWPVAARILDEMAVAPLQPAASSFPALEALSAEGAFSLLSLVLRGSGLFLGVVLVLALARRLALRGRNVGVSPTWDCGYLCPSPRMQYTGASFIDPAVWSVRSLLREKVRLPRIRDYFPVDAAARVSAPDWMARNGFVPLFRGVAALARLCKTLQHGRLNAYILYILLTLVLLLAWKLR